MILFFARKRADELDAALATRRALRPLRVAASPLGDCLGISLFYVSVHVEKAGEQLGHDPFAAPVIVDQAFAQAIAVMSKERGDDGVRLGLGSVEQCIFDLLNRLEPLGDGAQGDDMLLISGGSGKCQEQVVGPLAGRSVRKLVGTDLRGNRGASMFHERDQQIEMPVIKLPKHRFGHHWCSKTVIFGGFDEPLAGQSMKRIAHRCHACIEIFRKNRYVEPRSRPVESLAEALLDHLIDALEGARGSHETPALTPRPARRASPGCGHNRRAA